MDLWCHFLDRTRAEVALLQGRAIGHATRVPTTGFAMWYLSLPTTVFHLLGYDFHDHTDQWLQ